jgi:preprotein translocase subunit SecF
MNIIGKRKIWFAISIAIIIPGIISLFMWGLKLGIDFTGGQEMEVQGSADQGLVSNAFESAKVKDIVVTTSGQDKLLVRYSDKGIGDSEALHQQIKTNLSQVDVKETSFNSIGPAISQDITRNAILAIFFASIAIVLYIAFAFRNTPPPVTSWSFGVTAIVALLHDALVVIGIFSILGHFLNVQVDSMFVTAILTVIGFSVHDTIVVYDRIRENLRKYNKPFEEVVNDSINETLSRSLNTSITVLLVLFSLYLFGGASIKTFILALLIGIISGTYSSIFNASPLLVVWNN